MLEQEKPSNFENFQNTRFLIGSLQNLKRFEGKIYILNSKSLQLSVRKLQLPHPPVPGTFLTNGAASFAIVDFFSEQVALNARPTNHQPIDHVT